MTKVLVVDDEPALLRAVGAALKAREYDVATAMTGHLDPVLIVFVSTKLNDS